MPDVVLIVGDQPSLRQMLRFALNIDGVQVIEAESGLDTFDKLANHKVDMMIIDWLMPDMTGLVLIRHVRKSGDYSALPIVIISDRDDLSARKEARSLGVMTWLKKPFRVAEVQLAVKKGLELCGKAANRHVEPSTPGRF